jgi:hypothetical protein
MYVESFAHCVTVSTVVKIISITDNNILLNRRVCRRWRFDNDYISDDHGYGELDIPARLSTLIPLD